MTSLPFEYRGPVTPTPEESFDRWWPVFWKAWPHKVDKQEAMKEFRKALRIATPEQIIDGEGHYIQSKPDWQNWMGPAKFLRRRRWEDVYEVPGKPRVDPEQVWRNRASMAKTTWAKHQVCRQDIEECHRRGLLSDEELAEALR